MLDVLFEPVQLGALSLPNRIVLPAMHLTMGRNFRVTDALVDFYARRAQGGVGLIVVGYATVDQRSGNPSNIGAHLDEHIEGLRRLARAIQAEGARAAVQINHAGRYNYSFFLGGEKAVAPSAVPCHLTRETPRALEEDEILEVIQAYGQAARRVAEAGYDAVELLAGTGYLVSQFLSPLTNLRDDGWGGGLEQRMRFGREVVRAMRRAAGPDYPILARVNGNDMVPGGIGRVELRSFAQALVEEGVVGLDMNVGWHESRVPQLSSEVPAAAFAYLARELKQAVEVPVIAGHRIDDPHLARRLLLDGDCDLVALGRALIADPDLPRKAMEGREAEVLHCLACGQGCFDAVFHLRAVQCLANPRAGHERARAPLPAEDPGRVVVVGGGAAGLSAAAAAAERGHEVILLEADTRLGGQLHIAATPPGRSQFGRLAGELAARAAALGVQLQLGAVADADAIAALQPDAVVVATGALPVQPELPGADLPHVVQAWQLLQGLVPAGQRVVVVGGNAVGVETALLVAEQGSLSGEAVRFLLVHGADEPQAITRAATRGARQVTVVELARKLGQDLGKSTRWGMLMDIERTGVDVRTGTRAVAIEPGAVRVLCGEDEQEQLLPADTVVLALGARSHDPLSAELAARGFEVTVVGDAAKVADAMNAIHSGFLAGTAI